MPRIAYITYEYPPEIHAGGIATYVYEASRMMIAAGWEVEVICAAFSDNSLIVEDSVIVNRIKAEDVEDFRLKAATVFSERNSVKPFDIYETPEINANALIIARQFPDIPFVTRLHTPVALQMRLLSYYTPLKDKLRFVAGSILKGKPDLGYWRKYDKHRDIDKDYQITIAAQGISSPSGAMKRWAQSYWKIRESDIQILPNVFSASEALLKQKYSTERSLLTFIGKINVHKGMVSLMDALPKILRELPHIEVCLIGGDGKGPAGALSMKDLMQSRLSEWKDRIHFTGVIPMHEVYRYLNKSVACIFPSVWEAFGYVALEAMSAGIPLIVSKGSGLEEIINYGNSGVAVNQFSPKNIAKETIALISNKERLAMLSIASRQRAESYSANSLKHIYEAYYNKIITQK